MTNSKITANAGRGSYDRLRKAQEQDRRRKGKVAQNSPEYKEKLRKKHSLEGDCKCPYHVKARERAHAEAQTTS